MIAILLIRLAPTEQRPGGLPVDTHSGRYEKHRRHAQLDVYIAGRRQLELGRGSYRACVKSCRNRLTEKRQETMR